LAKKEKVYTYRKIKLSKKNGKFRDIYIPDESFKRHLNTLLKPLAYIYEKKHIYDCDHAFFKGRNCVTNASCHLKNRYILSLDIKDFFDNITSKHLEKYISEDILYFILIKSRLPQGYPTSPYAANIAVIELDRMIVENLRSFDSNIIYSRYADDLTFSFDEKEKVHFIISEVIKICNYFNFKLNTNKIRLQDKNNGRAVITGVGVSYYNVHPTRKTLKRLRAARHQGNEAQASGLAEWASCKLPNTSGTK
tara:strand:+ start:1749 stop:2501 length:753 start_codon:yes stop_codon:yes gene_type:complete